MTNLNPTFNVKDYELRNVVNDYYSPEQLSKVQSVELRVQNQLDYLAQMLGWSGGNYWYNLASTASEKRQLLGGTFGVYNSFILPDVLSVRDWSDLNDFEETQYVVEIKKDPRIKVGQIAHLDIYTYEILSLKEVGDTYLLNFGSADKYFLTQISLSVPLRISVPESRPEPFYRPTVGVSGDAFFHCARGEIVKPLQSQLILHPNTDTKELFPYLSNVIFSGSTYYFDQPVYLSLSDTLSEDILPEYDPLLERWVINIPPSLTSDSIGITANLVRKYSNPSDPEEVSVATVVIKNWQDPSDWNKTSVLEYFYGAWGNKGESLSFNLAFDSLSIHGFNEENSLYLPPVIRELSFNDLVDTVYASRAKVDYTSPGLMKKGQLWWDLGTNSLAIQFKEEEGCEYWVQVLYREPPKFDIIPEFVFPDVATFNSQKAGIPEGTTSIVITNAVGISSDDGVIDLSEPIPGQTLAYLYKETNSDYWRVVRFVFETPYDFNFSALSLPFGVPVYIENSQGLQGSGSNYRINNLQITVAGNYRTVLVKENTERDWTLFPDSVLKFIPRSESFQGPLEGELWWDYLVSDPNERAAKIYTEGGWVPINEKTPISQPPDPLDLSTVLFYCDGTLLSSGIEHRTDNYSFFYIEDPTNGKYTVSYTPLNSLGKIEFPKIEISDSVTSSYREDITSLVFSGLTYRMSPNVCDAEAPLRLWKPQQLQVSDLFSLVDRNTYENPLIADQNCGPCVENWQNYFVRLPLDYSRNGPAWQAVSLICQNFGYFGTSLNLNKMKAPPQEQLPKIYEEIYLLNDRKDYSYVYSEPYFYSTVIFTDYPFDGNDISYSYGVITATADVPYDDFDEAKLVDYEPLHNRLVNFSQEKYGDWVGAYYNINACHFLSGHTVNDVFSEAISPVAPPPWDASIYKLPPLNSDYDAEPNNYKIGYAYFVADASAAEDGFFDPRQEASWRYPITQPRTLYMVPRG